MSFCYYEELKRIATALERIADSMERSAKQGEREVEDFKRIQEQAVKNGADILRLHEAQLLARATTRHD